MVLNEMKTCLDFSLYSKETQEETLKLLCPELEVKTVMELRHLRNTIKIFKDVIIRLKIIY